uniref:Uncharacterized protein n=1 Tax=Chromera velia CCMP2878 TaxID=1169474 RepID=A0A0G4FDJ3_9ALVE|eukprot:Cvel_16484.t1-p1 / transcript=Cvel_16484.t1 / gene=Cvel_16484 / organism=Chromera_velia_CCMP2878 / gene_product=hypothetical protein / transcript_product=hypothetical protein / location=Cvel_scaffold1271:2142-7637(-) / protein_length=451 / sequence_SO=supercontig / SO=protein_coding / is_pseudo=false
MDGRVTKLSASANEGLTEGSLVELREKILVLQRNRLRTREHVQRQQDHRKQRKILYKTTPTEKQESVKKEQTKIIKEKLQDLLQARLTEIPFLAEEKRAKVLRQVQAEASKQAEAEGAAASSSGGGPGGSGAIPDAGAEVGGESGLEKDGTSKAGGGGEAKDRGDACAFWGLNHREFSIYSISDERHRNWKKEEKEKIVRNFDLLEKSYPSQAYPKEYQMPQFIKTRQEKGDVNSLDLVFLMKKYHEAVKSFPEEEVMLACPPDPSLQQKKIEEREKEAAEPPVKVWKYLQNKKMDQAHLLLMEDKEQKKLLKERLRFQSEMAGEKSLDEGEIEALENLINMPETGVNIADILKKEKEKAAMRKNARSGSSGKKGRDGKGGGSGMEKGGGGAERPQTDEELAVETATSPYFLPFRCRGKERRLQNKREERKGKKEQKNGQERKDCVETEGK